VRNMNEKDIKYSGNTITEKLQVVREDDKK
jgi:hypothetical protein